MIYLAMSIQRHDEVVQSFFTTENGKQFSPCHYYAHIFCLFCFSTYCMYVQNTGEWRITMDVI